MPQVIPPAERGIPWDPKRADGRERAGVGPAQRVLALAVMDQLPLAAVRQVQIAHEHVARIEASAFVVAVTRVVIAVVTPVFFAVSGVVVQ